MNPQSVIGVIFSSNRTSVLLVKRRDVPVWVLPGGGVDKNEPPRKAIIREILEETGLTVKVDRLVGRYSPINRLSKHTHLYECIVVDGKIAITPETRDIRSFPIDDLPPLPPPFGEWIHDATLFLPPIEKKLTSVTYFSFIKNLITHPILVFRFVLSRMGLSINT